MTSQGLIPARNAGLSSHRPGKLNNSKWPLSKFSRAMTTKNQRLRTALLAGIKPYDVIMHKVYCRDGHDFTETKLKVTRVESVSQRSVN